LGLRRDAGGGSRSLPGGQDGRLPRGRLHQVRRGLPAFQADAVLLRRERKLVHLGVGHRLEEPLEFGEFHQARPRYSPVRVSTRITSPSSTKRGMLTVAPDSSSAGLVPPDTVSPRTPGSVLVIFSSIMFGSVT